MGYKYRQGSTPDHVDSGGSNAKYAHVGLPTDSTRKVAPVDTTQLKNRIINTELKFTGGQDRPGTASTMKGLEAKQDTLNLARAGKIPATAGKGK